MSSPTSTPLPQVPTFWEQWGEVLFFLGMVVGTSVWMWTQPASAHFYLLALFGIGCLFDALSLLYYALTFIKRRFHSGLPLVGFAFYFWAWLAYPQPVLLAGGGGFWRTALAKLPDLLALGAAHALVHLSLPLLLHVTKREIHHGNAPETPDLPPRP